MIPLREQEAIRLRFEQELTARARIDYFTQRPSKVIIPGREECAHCEDVRVILEEISRLSQRISLTVRELAIESKAAAAAGVDKVPGIAIRGQANRAVRFSGIPMGAQFPVLIDAIIEAARGATGLKPDTSRQLKKLKEDARIQVFVLPTCPHAPAVARAAWRMALESARVTAEVVEVTEFPALAQRLGITASPSTLINETLLIPGAMDEGTLLKAILAVAEGREFPSSEFTPGPATMLEVPRQQPSTARPQRSSGGIILPR